MIHILMRIVLIVCATAFPLVSMSAVIVRGNDTTAPFGFAQEIQTQDFDKRTGSFFVGLDANAETYGVSKALRPTFELPPSFIGLIPDTSSLFNRRIEFLSLSLKDLDPAIITVVGETNSTPFTSTRIHAINENDGDNTGETDQDLNDASGTNATAGIIDIVATPDHIMAAVLPNDGDPFGDSDSGIALVQIKRKTINNPAVSLPADVVFDSLIVKDATTGFDGNQAAELEDSSTQLKGDSGGNDVIFATGDDENQVTMHYDASLDRGYFGVRIASGAAVGDIAKAVVLLDIDETNNNALILRPIVADAALQPPADAIITVENDAASSTDVRALLLRTLHATTGPDYLIVNGGIGETDEVGNQIFALPLVYNPSDRDTHGTLANKNAALVDGKFTTPALLPAELPNSSGEPAYLVGAGDLPIEPDHRAADIFVIADTVYVSIATEPDADNETGILFSQALFDSTGKIIRWTPWTRRASPYDAFPGVELPGNIAHDGSVSFFAVDATQATVWLVEATTNTVVGVTNWTTVSYPTSLLNVVNNSFGGAKTAVLDLDQATRGFVEAGGTVHRYALFGGKNYVAFARTSEATIPSDIASPQTVITDFSLDENFHLSLLPDAGCINVLEYARQTAAQGATNYFFAGSSSGLFAYADQAGNGFLVTNLLEADQPVIEDGVWHQITAIPGSVIDIKTSGNANSATGTGNLYVLTIQSNAIDPILQATLYSIPFTTNLSTMFAPANIRTIAQTEVTPFTDALQFYGIQIIASGTPTSDSAAPTKEQLILTTSQGLYYSNATQIGANGILDALTQTDANWTLITSTGDDLFNGIAGINTPIRHTVWPFSLQDPTHLKTFENGTLDQLSAAGNSTGTALTIAGFNPEEFIAQTTNPALLLFDPLNTFYSDGGRRFFVTKPAFSASQDNTLIVYPYFVEEWNVQSINPLNNRTINNLNHINWLSLIGATGLLFAGTNQGIVSFE